MTAPASEAIARAIGEREAALWKEGAAHVHFGLCHRCKQTHDETGRPLLVARQPRARHFFCLPCWRRR